ncbi:serine/threonine protein kinase [Pendulispora brunnea]|uniref:Serine/threonine protein kinase n=1 Tax=Pendulispora brunnea TaxID=2905690 RepID=A0ABZ2KM09_9BACT
MAMQLPNETFPAGTVLLGKYRVERLLGHGGMGMVVAALNMDLGQHVALKFIRTESVHRAALVERFMQEARAASRLRSEHVARVIDVGKLETGSPYMVMELLEGRDLKTVLAEDGPLPPAVAIDYVLQAIDAVAEAHQLGIVHRDLKPANLFLANRADGERVVKLLDFGISKAQNTLDESGDRLAITGTTAFLGSPAYASPEQCRSPKDVDGRTDIWSLGAILYELMTGQRPFQAQSEAEMVAAVLLQQHVPLRTWMPHVPPVLDEAIARCLRKNPHERFSTVAELAVAIAPFGTGHANRSVERAVRLTGYKLPPNATSFAQTPLTVGMQTQSAVSAVTASGQKRFPWSVAVAILVGVVVALSLVAAVVAVFGKKHDVVPATQVPPPVSSPSPSITVEPPAPPPAPASAQEPSVATSATSAPAASVAKDKTEKAPRPRPQQEPKDLKESVLKSRQ